jgi:hypothetical protein
LAKTPNYAIRTARRSSFPQTHRAAVILQNNLSLAWIVHVEDPSIRAPGDRPARFEEYFTVFSDVLAVSLRRPSCRCANRSPERKVYGDDEAARQLGISCRAYVYLEAGLIGSADRGREENPGMPNLLHIANHSKSSAPSGLRG